jgi:uncharacterized DUF497 family protein
VDCRLHFDGVSLGALVQECHADLHSAQAGANVAAATAQCSIIGQHDEAETVFMDEKARLIDDPDHSNGEERFLLLGYSLQARCLIVSHCYREADSVIRLISARWATAGEEEMYWSFHEK